MTGNLPFGVCNFIVGVASKVGMVWVIGRLLRVKKYCDFRNFSLAEFKVKIISVRKWSGFTVMSP